MIFKLIIWLFAKPPPPHIYIVRLEDSGMIVGAFHDKKKANKYKRDSSNAWVQKIEVG